MHFETVHAQKLGVSRIKTEWNLELDSSSYTKLNFFWKVNQIIKVTIVFVLSGLESFLPFVY